MSDEQTDFHLAAIARLLRWIEEGQSNEEIKISITLATSDAVACEDIDESVGQLLHELAGEWVDDVLPILRGLRGYGWSHDQIVQFMGELIRGDEVVGE
jgi:hypothetical protein